MAKSGNTQTGALLFLYGNNSLTTQLKRGRLPLQQNWAFLEPFLSIDHWQGASNAVSEAEMTAGYQREYEKLPDKVRMWLSFNDFLGQKDKFTVQVKDHILSHQSSLKVVGYPKARFSKTAYLRLFDSPTCQFGWTDQADLFTGICVALRQQAICLKPMPGTPIVLQPVRYGVHHEFKATSDNPLPGAFMDVEENKSRGEWRAILPSRSDDTPAIKIKRQDIQQIYVSVMTPEETITDLQQLIRTDLNFRHVELFLVKPEGDAWRLTAEHLPTD